MGTRHLICAVKDGKYRIAQYGQWDGYPAGQGASILEFLKSNKVDALKENMLKCSWLSDEEAEAMWKEFGVDTKKDRFVSSKIADKFYAKYPELNRDTGAEILTLVADTGSGLKLIDSIDFACDSVFCEWAYVIDFDKNTFEIYKGFNDKPLDKSERFFSENLVNYSSSTTYYPVRLIATYPLSELPTSEDFITQCDPPEDDE